MSAAYRADHVGSFLRPAEVQEARAACGAGRLPLEQLHHIEDRAILAALERQRSLGVDVFTDGEVRRSGFQNDLVEAVEGFVATARPAVVRIWQGPGGEPQEQGTRQVVGGTLRQVRRLTESQTRFLQAHAPGPVKMTVPSPNQFPASSVQAGVTEQFYPTRSALLGALVAIIKGEIAALVADGVPYIQVDEPRDSYDVDPKWRQHLRDVGEDPDRMFDEAIAADNACREGIQRQGLTGAMPICRGHNESQWYAAGGYAPIAEQLFGSLSVDRDLREYDTARAGTFAPLRCMPRDKMVVLGLVSNKEPGVEVQDELRHRIDAASCYVPIENLALSPQCGFASTAAGNRRTEDEQWRKLELVVETARKVWGS